jgi:hypothetical protein
MTTIHRPAPINLWWYVAVAVAAGIVLTLAVLVLQGGHDATGAPSLVPGPVPHFDRPSQVCFATPHNPSIELLRAGCIR